MPKRFFQIFGVCLLSLAMLGAGTPSTSFDKIGHQLVCQCGCGQILLECNHVGCPVSGPMIEELKTQLASGLSSSAVLNKFISKYGPIVLAAPIRGGFDNVAWIVPFAVLTLGIAGVALLIRFWRRRHTQMQLAGAMHADPGMAETVRDRIRRETDLQ